MTDEEFTQYKEFEEKGNSGLQLAVTGAAETKSFAYGVQAILAMFGDADFSQPFRIVVDYDPGQPKAIVKRYLTNEAHESYTALIEEKLKVAQSLGKRRHKSNDC